MSGRLEAIDREIAECRERIAAATGGETEVYDRIVGYYRPVSRWNKGKRLEFDMRKRFLTPESQA